MKLRLAYRLPFVTKDNQIAKASKPPMSLESLALPQQPHHAVSKKGLRNLKIGMPECPNLTRKATSPCLLLSGSTRNVHGIEGLPSFKQIQQELKISQASWDFNSTSTRPFFKKIKHARIVPICVATLLIPAGIVGEIHEVPALQKFRSSIFAPNKKMTCSLGPA